MFAQSAEDEVIRLKQSMGTEAVQSDQEVVQSNLEADEKRLAEKDGLQGHFNMSVGTSFTYMKGYGSGMGFYAAPMYTLPLNNRWSLYGGFVVSNYTGLSMHMPGGESQSPNSFNSLAVFAAASYKMSDRLILHGSGLKNLTSYPLTPMGPGLMDNLSLGATYKLGDNISIGATIHINQGHGYYQSPSFGGSHFGGRHSSPFGW
ncbi:MAG: hypothetical protein GY790_15340 [Bacteroidetes bacterium]|nr:hypothetical protein [Bacteroidota bacterium]